MEHYDLRIIADCLVFSYEVEGPQKPNHKISCEKKCSSRRDRKKAKQRESVARTLLGVLIVLLMPFALLADAVLELCRRSVRLCGTLLHERRRAAKLVGTFSCFTLLGAMLHYL